MKHFRVVAIDHLGFGKSDRPDFKFDDFESSMNFFVIPVVQVIKLLDLRQLIIIGHSYSGLISAHLVPRVRERVLGVWLASPAGFNRKSFTEYEKKQLLNKFGKKYKVGADFMELIVYLTFEKVVLTIQKVPLFKLIFKSVIYEYISQFFKRKDLKLTPNEIDLFTRYYQVIYSLDTCGHTSLNTLLTFGAYSEFPVLDISGSKRTNCSQKQPGYQLQCVLRRRGLARSQAGEGVG